MKIINLSFAQTNLTQTVRGKIIDSESKSPIPGVTILIADSDPLIAMTSDAEGEFRLNKVPVGIITLKAMMLFTIVSARSFTIEETDRYAGTWVDPARMAANYAGVMAVGDQRNDIIIKGNSPLGLLRRLEGVSIPNPNHFGTLRTTGAP